MEPDVHNIQGIVVGQKSNNIYFVWCKENQPKQDVMLFASNNKPVSVGNWVHIKMSRVDYEKLGKVQVKVSDYMVIAPYYKTEPHGKTVQVKLSQYLMENQLQIDHHVFGKIYNDMGLKFSSGLYDLTIVRVSPQPHMESVWVLAKKDPVPLEPSGQEVDIIGIVTGWGSNFWYIYSKDSPPGLELTIENVPTIGMGAWLQLTVTREQLKRTGRIRCDKYTVIPDIHETNVNNSEISLKMSCWIPAGSKNIWHPTVGEIHNIHSLVFEKSGTYSITIYRQIAECWKEKPIPKQWILGSRPSDVVLLQECQQATIPGRQSLVDQYRIQPKPEPKSLSVVLGNSNLGLLKPQPPAILMQQSQPVGQGFSERARSKSRNHRSKSRKRNKTPLPTPRGSLASPEEGPSSSNWNLNNPPNVKQPGKLSKLLSDLNLAAERPQQLPSILQQPPPQRDRSKSRNHRSKSRKRNKTPIPAPRRSLESPQEGPSTSRNPSKFCRAMILQIVKKEQREDIYVWIFDKQETGQLRLNVAAEKYNLEPGRTFRAPFTEVNKKWKTYGPISDLRDDEYKTRLSRSGMLQIQVKGKALGSPDAEHGYFPWIAHDDFGDILDNRTQLQHHLGLLYTFWIKQIRIDNDNNSAWVVVEQELNR